MSDERGSATVEFVWVSLLLLVPFVYVMVTVFEAQRAAFGIEAASRSAAKAFVSAPSVEVARARAESAGRAALLDHDVEGASIDVECLSACFTSGSSVRVRVRVDQPLPLAPTLFGDSIASIRLASTHTEPYGQFREAAP